MNPYITYARSGGRTAPRDRERLNIGTKGEFTLWRSIGWATNPPSPVGRFAGQLEAGLAELEQAAQTAMGAGDLDLPLMPDTAIERIELLGAQAELGIHDEPPVPWKPLIEQLRLLLGSLTRFPEAAIALELADSGRKARLTHLGSESLALDLSELNVRVVLWQDEFPKVEWQLEKDEGAYLDRIVAEPGWSFQVPFDHHFELGRGRKLAVYVNLGLYDDDLPIPISLYAEHAASSSSMQ